jgi:hypothetical protein
LQRSARRLSTNPKQPPLSAEQKKWQNSNERLDELKLAESRALGFGALSLSMVGVAWWWTDGFNKSFAIGPPASNPSAGKYDPE